jgi:RNA polymerase sigma factor
MQAASINERVAQLKHDEDEINRFVEEYKPFIAASVEKVIGRYVRYGEDDELSIALIAFVEAIRSYNSFKGSFLSFAQNVIKRRLIDYYRKEKKHSKVVSINEYLMENGEEEVDLTTIEAVGRYTQQELAQYRRFEIEELEKELAGWGISFSELAEASPKHNSTRRIYNDIVRFLLMHPDLVLQLRFHYVRFRQSPG